MYKQVVDSVAMAAIAPFAIASVCFFGGVVAFYSLITPGIAKNKVTERKCS